MPDKKPTDNEIKKALECCGKNPPICNVCGYRGRCNRIDCYDYLKRDTLDLINRLQAENERLKNCVKSEDEVRAIAKRTMEPLVKEITREQIDIAVKQAKVEAYKEFAKKVNDEISEAVYSNHRAITERINEHNANRYEDKICSMWDDQITALVSIRFYIDNLLKEMAGENNA